MTPPRRTQASRRPFMVPQMLFTLVVLCALVVPATSWAGDPLLSGYGGPGTGQQVLLGSHLLGKGGGGSGGGSLRATVAPAAVAGVQGTPTQGVAKGTGGHVSSKGRSRAHAGRKPSATAGTSTAVPRPVAYPARADDGGGFPLSAGEVLAGLLALAAIAGMGVWMRRVTAHGGGPGAQAPS